MGFLYSFAINISENVAQNVSIARFHTDPISRNLIIYLIKKLLISTVISLYRNLRHVDNVRLEIPQRFFPEPTFGHRSQNQY